MSGWYKMYRGWMDHEAFRSNDERIAWLWMIEHAATKKIMTASKSGTPVKINRGELSYSQSYMAMAWNVSRQNVRSTLTHFQKWELISTRTNAGQTVIKIHEYGKYQDKLNNQTINQQETDPKANEYAGKQDKAEGKVTSEPTRPQPDPNHNNKKDKELKRNNIRAREEDNPVWFEGEVIRLRRNDYEDWLGVYGGRDEQFMEFLGSRDEWLEGQRPEVRKNWFISTGNYLARMRENA